MDIFILLNSRKNWIKIVSTMVPFSVYYYITFPLPLYYQLLLLSRTPSSYLIVLPHNKLVRQRSIAWTDSIKNHQNHLYFLNPQKAMLCNNPSFKYNTLPKVHRSENKNLLNENLVPYYQKLFTSSPLLYIYIIYIYIYIYSIYIVYII